jgi:DNA polymerase III subunit epsilon
VDTETTGLSNPDELIELAIILFTYNNASGEINKIDDLYTGLRQPNVPVSKGAENVHHITKQQLAGCKLDDLKVKQLISVADIIIAHNAAFDYRFISQLYPEVNNNQWFCSMNGIKWGEKGHVSKSLEYLLKAYDISEEQSHRAMDDTMGVFKLLQIPDTSTGNTLFIELMDHLPLNLNNKSSQFRPKQEDVITKELLLPLPKRKKGFFEKLFEK